MTLRRFGRQGLLLATLMFATAINSASSPPPSHDSTAFWVWRWSDLDRTEPQAPLMLYQGDYLLAGERASFTKRGIDPFAIPENQDAGIVVRLYEIEGPEEFVAQVAYLLRQWRAHGVNITEVQLDYDSPSRELAEYKQFIDRTRALLAHESLDIPISITGLITWLRDDPPALEQLAESVTYIAFQLYDVYEPLDDLAAYMPSLQQFDYPYKIGITTSDKFSTTELPRNEHFKGFLVFLNIPT